MTRDASFEDGGDKPIRLRALDADDLAVVSALVQDAVFPITEMSWQRRQRRFVILLNRFRWEDKPLAEARQRSYERVQSLLSIEDVQTVQSQGIDRSETETILSLLGLSFEPGEDGGGRLRLTISGDGAVAIQVEALEVTLQDVTRPYIAPSKAVPDHPE